MATDGIDLIGDAAQRITKRNTLVNRVEEREKLYGIADFILEARAKRERECNEEAKSFPIARFG